MQEDFASLYFPARKPWFFLIGPGGWYVTSLKIGVIIYISIIQTLPPCCMKKYPAMSEMFYSSLYISQEPWAAELNYIFVILFMPSICLLFIWGNFAHFGFLCSLFYCIAIHLPVPRLGLRSAVYCTDSVPGNNRAFVVSKAKI